MKTIAFLYKWTHIPTQKWYVGSRTAVGCHPDDGYICSSKIVKPMILENRNEWVREILAIGESDYIRELEGKYLELLDAKHNTMSYNKHNGDGKFSVTGKKVGPRSAAHKANWTASVKGRAAWNKGLSKASDLRVLENSLRISESKKGKPGHLQTIETCLKIAATEKATKSKNIKETLC